MDMPEPALALIDERYGDASWALLHAWISDETVLAVVAVAPDDAFDPSEDAFDVDAVLLEHLQLAHDAESGWSLSVDGEASLRDVFEELVASYEDANEAGEAPLES